MDPNKLASFSRLIRGQSRCPRGSEIAWRECCGRNTLEAILRIDRNTERTVPTYSTVILTLNLIVETLVIRAACVLFMTLLVWRKMLRVSVEGGMAFDFECNRF